MENLIKLSDDQLWQKINERHLERGGIYKVIVVNDAKPVIINRFLGNDSSGLIYLGKANSFLDRVIGLKKTISENFKSKSHIGGRRYNSNINIAKKFPFTNLYLELIEAQNPIIMERELLKKYFDEFGEVPPLNAVL